ncbi:AoPex11B [Colletotrichum karsti]|uniref:AoPex11B n=1 Tax=Colletotrichum karsti TaxID=1095194 RepID=A0A9P6I536_9PEZI|nr:AoPex11B [Colletotrichum karsti]KAF9876174.1 AoPex11B [Colletotrichum karsti]
MTSFKYDQFVAFGADSAGLERILRGLQALTAIVSSTPALLALVLSTPDPVLDALGPLRGHLNLTRRFIRFFWFLNSFGTSYNLYTSISPPSTAPGQKSSGGAGLETWLDILKFTLLGLYGGLESLTLPDLLGVPQIQFFGPERTRALNVEAQRFWFLALFLGIVGNVIRITKSFAYAPVPQHGAGYGTGEKPNGTAAAGDEKAAEKTEVVEETKAEVEDEKLDLNAERARLKALVVKRREGMRKWRRQVAFKVKSLGRKVISDSLDCIIPGVILGWVNIGPGAVGVAMFITTVLTSRDIWERCGAGVAAKRGVA